jgi:hypothetical protein
MKPISTTEVDWPVSKSARTTTRPVSFSRSSITRQ